MFVDPVLPEQGKHADQDPHCLLGGLCWRTSFFVKKSLNNVFQRFHQQAVADLPNVAHSSRAALRSIPTALQ
jgi:hypothetical protein